MSSTQQVSMPLEYIRKRTLCWWPGSVNNREARAIDGMESSHWEGPLSGREVRRWGPMGEGGHHHFLPQRSG